VAADRRVMVGLYAACMDAELLDADTSQDAALQIETVVTSGSSTDVVELVEDELLVEEISIDGMCGVY
jgi:mycofactocin precursor